MNLNLLRLFYVLLILGPAATQAADLARDSDAVRSQPALYRETAARPGMAAGEATEAATLDAGYPWRGARPQQPDWPGARRDFYYFLGWQFATIAVLYVSPEAVSGWDSEDKKNYSFRKWRDNVRHPEWDNDRWWINYVLHPYWGGAYYIRARERGFDRAQSFWYSVLLSAAFEYGAEALYEPVSIQDLFVTPVAGYLLGEYLFAPWRERIRARPGPLTWSDKAALFLTDPLGVANAEADRVLGVQTSLRLAPLNPRHARHGAGTVTPADGMATATGSAGLAWGLQFRVDW